MTYGKNQSLLFYCVNNVVVMIIIFVKGAKFEAIGAFLDSCLESQIYTSPFFQSTVVSHNLGALKHDNLTNMTHQGSHPIEKP